MKNLFLTFLPSVFFLTTFLQAQEPAPSVNPQSGSQVMRPLATAAIRNLKWEYTTKDFGEIPQGVPATTEFTFTNNSAVPVSLTKVQKSCGCTEPKFSQEPVLPGKSSSISATFNAAVPGPFNKSLTVYTSDNETYALFIKGTVKPKQ